MGQIATVTIGSDAYSVYALTSNALSDGNTYFNGRLGASAWTSATDDNKRRAMVSAARDIDARSNFSGTKTVSTQPRAFPRDNAKCDGAAVPNNSVPDDLANGQFELALALLDDPTIQDREDAASKVKSVTAGPVSVSFFAPSSNTEGRLPPKVLDLIACFFEGVSLKPQPFGVDSTKTDEQSHFDSDTDDYERSEGFA